MIIRDTYEIEEDNYLMEFEYTYEVEVGDYYTPDTTTIDIESVKLYSKTLKKGEFIGTDITGLFYDFIESDKIYELIEKHAKDKL